MSSIFELVTVFIITAKIKELETSREAIQNFPACFQLFILQAEIVHNF